MRDERGLDLERDERAAAGLGINVVTTKLAAFAIAAAMAGLGGALTVFSGPVALFTEFTVLGNVNAVSHSVVGGAGSVLGALFGSALEPAGLGNAGLNSVLGVGPVTMALVGGILLLLTIDTAPDGIAAAARRPSECDRRRWSPRRPA